MGAILSDTDIRSALDAGQVVGPWEAAQLQPASLDLGLGAVAHRLRASFLPGRGRTVAETLPGLSMHQIDLTGGAVLETGGVYLVELAQGLALPGDVAALTNPKSSTGRLDVFTRVIGNGADRFDALPEGYTGPLWVEISPRTFSVLVRPGDRLVQLRLRRGTADPVKTVTVSIDLKGQGDGPIGWRARRHSPLVDLAGVGAHAAHDFWDPLHAPDGRLVLDPDEFYILASREAVEIPNDQAAEMAPIATEIGEFRAHYAGFFDPGFGVGTPSRAVLEVRGRDVPFLLTHGQPVARLVYTPLTGVPDALYGAGRAPSNYQGQGLRLGKHFCT